MTSAPGERQVAVPDGLDGERLDAALVAAREAVRERDGLLDRGVAGVGVARPVILAQSVVAPVHCFSFHVANLGHGSQMSLLARP